MKKQALQSRTSTTAPAHAAATPQPYVGIHMKTLRLNSALPFKLYTRIEGEFIVYRRENLPFTNKQRQALVENGIETLHISAEQIPQYWSYLRENLRSVVQKSETPLEERASLLYGSTTEMTRELLELPVTAESVETAYTVVQSVLEFLAGGKSVLHAVMREMETEPELHAHALNASHYGIALAHEVGMADQEGLKAFGLGLVLQDVGMLQIPKNLILKGGPLSFDEWAQIKRHPALGLEAVEGVPGVSDLTRTVIFGHHERIDGSGYPQGLAGNEVTLPLRIAGIVDVFTSLTMGRPYREAMNSYEALHSMCTEMASGFDPEILNAFTRVLGTDPPRH